MVESRQAPVVKPDREAGAWRRVRNLVPMVVVAVAFVALWELLIRVVPEQIWPRIFFPGPAQVANSLYGLWTGGLLLRAIIATLARLSVGFLISLVLGAILAFLMVHFHTFGKGIQPYVLGLQTFPSIAWVPLSVIWFGFSETALLFVTIVGSLFAVTVSFADALRTVPPVYLKAARNMGSDGMDLILRVTVPAALPHLLSVVGRLKPLIRWQQAETQVQTIARRLAETYPETNKDYGALVIPLQQEFVRDARLSLWLLLAASVLVLAIACSNVANMLLTRGVGRTREIAIRSALGAGRRRVARQLLAEGVLLSATACVVGVLFAAASFRFLDNLIPPALSGAVFPTVDLRLLGFAVLISLLSGIVFGLAPLRETFRVDLSEAFRARSAGSGVRIRSRAFLVAFETALAVVVVAGTGLVVRTIMNIGAVDPGFRPQNVLTLRLELAANQYPTIEKRIAFYREVLGRVHALPGVISAGFTTFLPYTNFGGATGFFAEGRSDIPPTVVYRRETSSEYLPAMGVSLLKGRWFTEEDDRNHPLVAIISEGAARLLDGDPIGRHVNFGNPRGPWLTVVGVVGDMREEGVDQPSRRAAVYTPYAQSTEVWFFNPRDLAIRVQGDPMSLAAAVQREVWAINPNQTVAQIRTLEAILDQQVSNRKLQAALLSAFSLLSISLAALGLYALLSFVVQARKQEFGVRMALGATPRQLVAAVLRQSVLWVGGGVVAGLAITLVVARSLSSLLYGVEPTDPLTLAASVFLLFGVGVSAALVPAWRASRIDPMVALRHE